MMIKKAMRLNDIESIDFHSKILWEHDSQYAKTFRPWLQEEIQWNHGLARGSKNYTHLRQGFGGSSAGERNPPKHVRSIAEKVPIRSYTFLHGQGRVLLRRRMKL